MSPFSAPVLMGAAVISSPALYRAFVEGTAPLEVALTRYLVAVAVCWGLLALVVTLVGPAPAPATSDAVSDAAKPDAATEREKTPVA
jgi:hypothetical protein